MQKRSVRICYPSSAAICASSKQAIRETSEIAPHNRLEMAIATAENWLKTYCYESDSNILPFIFRLGEVYGDDLGFAEKPGLVNHYLNAALKQKILQIPGLGSCYRSLSHIGDVCEASIKIMEMNIPPRCVNIPGERYSIIDIVVAIAEKYQTETCMGSGSEFGDDYSRYAGHRNLSASLFKNMVDFTPAHSFKNWLATVMPTTQSFFHKDFLPQFILVSVIQIYL
jgi:nucleoside-diphosphate-sugar epimerase